MKRMFDIIGAGVGILLTLPVTGGIAFLIYLQMGRPVLFWQTRPGLHGRPFRMVKFRTMRDAVNADGEVLPDSARLTRLGRSLRATSLDELPELWNVLRGEMSLVGPRPLLMEYLPLYTKEEMLRHKVRPGITGLAQVSGRNMVPWDERLALDVKYVRERNIMLDISIIVQTVFKVLKQDDIKVIPSITGKKLSDARSKK